MTKNQDRTGRKLKCPTFIKRLFAPRPKSASKERARVAQRLPPEEPTAQPVPNATPTAAPVVPDAAPTVTTPPALPATPTAQPALLATPTPAIPPAPTASPAAGRKQEEEKQKRSEEKNKEGENKKEEEGKERQKYNWDVVGLTSVAVTIAGAAIFYAAGWVYEARWYGYYGIDVSQLALAPHQVMIQGMLGILLLFVALLLSVFLGSLVTLLRPMFQRTYASLVFELPSIEFVFIGAYGMGFVLVLVAVLLMRELFGPTEIPWEVVITLVPGYLLLFAIWMFGASRDFVSKVIAAVKDEQGVQDKKEAQDERGKRGKRGFPAHLLLRLRLCIFARRFRKESFRKSWDESKPTERLKNILTELGASGPGSMRAKELDYLRSLSDKKAEDPQDRAKLLMVILALNQWAQIRQWGKEFAHSLRFALGLFLLLLFLISIATSALLGEFDARCGGRSLSGGWQLPQGMLYTEKAMPILQDYFSRKAGQQFVYGPLSLLYSSEDEMFLVSSKNTPFFEDRPTFYVVARQDVAAFRSSQPARIWLKSAARCLVRVALDEITQRSQ